MPVARSAKDLFENTALAYAKYRPEFPQPLTALLAKCFGNAEHKLLLDIGCGTGRLLNALAPHFASCVGVDPSPAMLKAAQAGLEKANIENTTLIEGEAENLPADVANTRFNLVTIACAFHWMDRPTVLQNLKPVLGTTGVLAVIDNGNSIWNRNDDWAMAAKTVLHHHLGKQRRTAYGTYTEPEKRHDKVMDESGYSIFGRHGFPYQRQYRIDDFIGLLYSTSFCNPSVLGNKKDTFEHDMRHALQQSCPNGIIYETGNASLILAKAK